MRLGLGLHRFPRVTGVAGGSSGGALLLEDGASFILMEDGISKLLLEA